MAGTMFSLLFLAALQERTTVLTVHVRVAQTCTLAAGTARCTGARGPAPVITHEPRRTTYSF